MNIIVDEKITYLVSSYIDTISDCWNFWSTESIKAFSEKNRCIFLFCLDNDLPVGFAMWSIQGEFSDLLFMYTIPSYRKKGVASLILEVGHRTLKSLDVKFSTLEVSSVNENAIPLYTKYGYEKCRKMPDYYGKGIDAWLMQLNLTI